jgi:alanine dehydrogenase
MIIGVPKEIKNHEYRVGLTVEAVSRLVSEGNQVLVEQGAVTTERLELLFAIVLTRYFYELN